MEIEKIIVSFFYSHVWSIPAFGARVSISDHLLQTFYQFHITVLLTINNGYYVHRDKTTRMLKLQFPVSY